MNSKSAVICAFLSVTLLFCFKPSISQGTSWTHFRGSTLNGIAADEVIPVKWDDTTLKWKTEIHDKGYSSPVVFNNQVWVTTAKADGKELYAVCLDFKTGEVIYDIKIFTPDLVDGKHSLNTYASPTPCIENGFVYVHYGSMGTACIKTEDGSIVWKRDDLKCKHVQGPASSPVIYKNLLILHFEGTDVRYIVALDKFTGKLVWRSDRPAEPYESLTVIGRKAYITPLLINIRGRDMLISNGSAICIAYDPDTGKEIWRVVNGGESTIAMPVAEKGVIYWYSGYMVAPDGTNFTELMAVNPDGSGDIKDTNVIWKKREELSRNQCLTPVIKDGLIYTVNTRNNMMCIDAATGDEIWTAHVTSNYDASPLWIDGNVWFFSVKGEVLILKAGHTYEVVGRNQLDSGIWATPAVLNNSILIRTQNYLYCIGNK